MKVITVPEPVSILGPNGEAPPEPMVHSMLDYLTRWPLNDARFGSSLDNMEHGVTIRQMFRMGGSAITITDGAHALLLSAVEKPQQPIPPFLAYQYLPFMMAVRDAASETKVAKRGKR